VDAVAVKYGINLLGNRLHTNQGHYIPRPRVPCAHPEITEYAFLSNSEHVAARLPALRCTRQANYLIFRVILRMARVLPFSLVRLGVRRRRSAGQPAKQESEMKRGNRMRIHASYFAAARFIAVSISATLVFILVVRI
jgi:hypothetical protein